MDATIAAWIAAAVFAAVGVIRAFQKEAVGVVSSAAGLLLALAAAIGKL